MTKSDLIKRVSQSYPHMSTSEIDSVVNEFFHVITSALASGEHVELRGFGSFTIKHRQPHRGRNPKTGETVAVAEKSVPFFKPGKALRENMQDIT